MNVWRLTKLATFFLLFRQENQTLYIDGLTAILQSILMIQDNIA